MKMLARLILICALSVNLLAQQAKGNSDPSSKDQPKHESSDPGPTFNFFKLSFVMSELDDGKRTNQRDYTMVLRTDNQPSSVHIATRVPVYTEEKKMTYVDAGLTLRCNAKEQADRRLQVHCDVEVSSFFRPDQQSGTSTGAAAPLLRSTRTESWALLTLGKPSILATVDDVNSTRRMQIELTATRVD